MKIIVSVGILILFLIILFSDNNNRVFKSLDENLNDLKIEKAFVISLPNSKRRQRFLNDYNCHIPLEIVDGVIVDFKHKFIEKATYGCTLAHVKTLELISKQKEGWYLVFEDDAKDDFSKIQSNIYVKNIIHKTKKSFINLSLSTLNDEIVKNYPDYSLNFVGWQLTAYLIKQEKALELSKRIKTYADQRGYPVDTTTALTCSERTFKNFWRGDDSGCRVNLIGHVGKSDRNQIQMTGTYI